MMFSFRKSQRLVRLIWLMGFIGPVAIIRVLYLPSGTSADEILLLKVGNCALYFATAFFVSNLLSIVFDRAVKGNRRPRLLRELATTALFLAAAAGCASEFLGKSASGVLAGSGLVIAIVGFAMRNVVADVLTGVAFGLEAPFRIGDWVDFEGTTKGQVVEIGWRSTRLLTRDATYMILPNSQVARQRLTNYSAPRRHYRSQVSIVISHNVEVARAKDILLGGALCALTILKDPPPDVRAVALDLDGVVYSVRYWVPTFAHDVDCRDEVLAALDYALRQARIGPSTRHSAMCASSTAEPHGSPGGHAEASLKQIA